mmetsp:Transcript_29331/g.52505  ORF Transcript_29331/g.52505 Transcript_29331/m.52505 type:complete len:284 (-) Transcript_29331:41-892(-)
MDKLDTSSSSAYQKKHTPLQHATSISFSPDKTQDPLPRSRKSIAFILHKCYLCSTEGTTKTCKKCRREVCLSHSLGSVEVYCVECERVVKSEINREDYQKLLVKAHKELKLVFSGVEQKRREKAEMSESYAQLEEQIKVKKTEHSAREIELRTELDRKVEENTATVADVEVMKARYAKARETEENYKRLISESRQQISLMTNELNVHNQEREISADQLRELNLKAQEVINVQKLHKVSCSECQRALEEKYNLNRSPANFKKFSIAQEKKIEEDKRDLCRCLLM